MFPCIVRAVDFSQLSTQDSVLQLRTLQKYKFQIAQFQIRQLEKDDKTKEIIGSLKQELPSNVVDITLLPGVNERVGFVRIESVAIDP